MKILNLFSGILIFILYITNTSAQHNEFPLLRGPYLGQEPPENTPVKFFFDLMPAGYRLHSAPAFTPDGKEVYFSAMDFSIRFSEKIFVMNWV